MLLTKEACDKYDLSRNRNEAILTESALTCDNYRWSPMMHILALSSALGLNIISAYPQTKFIYRGLFHKVVKPLEGREDAKHSNRLLAVMWTKDGECEVPYGTYFLPNHFVPLLHISAFKALSEAPVSPMCEQGLSESDSDHSLSADETPKKVAHQSKDMSHPNLEKLIAEKDLGIILSEGVNVNLLTREQKLFLLDEHFLPNRFYPMPKKNSGERENEEAQNLNISTTVARKLQMVSV